MEQSKLLRIKQAVWNAINLVFFGACQAMIVAFTTWVVLFFGGKLFTDTDTASWPGRAFWIVLVVAFPYCVWELWQGPRRLIRAAQRRAQASQV